MRRRAHDVGVLHKPILDRRLSRREAEGTCEQRDELKAISTRERGGGVDGYTPPIRCLETPIHRLLTIVFLIFTFLLVICVHACTIPFFHLIASHSCN
jgi:hypothetical protein